MGQTDSPKIRTLIANLRVRRVLVRAPGGGFARGNLSAASA